MGYFSESYLAPKFSGLSFKESYVPLFFCLGGNGRAFQQLLVIKGSSSRMFHFLDGIFLGGSIRTGLWDSFDSEL